MSTEVAVTETTALIEASFQERLTAMGFSAEDFIIPRLMLMQNTSSFVGDEEAKLGDVVNNQTKEILGGIGKPIEIVPIMLTKMHATYDVSAGTPKMMKRKRLEDVPASLHSVKEGNENGVPVKYYIQQDFHVLLRSELDLGEAFPYLITFKSTSLMAAKKLATHIAKLQYLRKSPYSKSVELTVRKDKKDSNTYAVFDIGATKDLAGKPFEQANQWAQDVRAFQFKVAEEEVDEDVGTTGPQKVTPTVVGQSAQVQF